MPGSDLGRSIAYYRDLAQQYDRNTRRIDVIRRRAIEALGLLPGDTVLDAGCGTGWCLQTLMDRVGAGGSVVAFDPSPEMLAVARARMNGGAERTRILEASAQAVVLPAAPNAILFSFTHDLVCSPLALDNVLRQAAGARVAAVGTKLYAPWLFPANWFVKARHRGYITDFDSLGAPWALLSERLADFRLTAGPFTQHYVATGRVPFVQEA
jgi:SAM-dependent methyltransferase